MELLVIGAGPAYTDKPGAVGACYLVTSGDDAIVLDLGHGAYSGLAAAREPSTVLAVVISHLHPDHFVDLVPLRHHLRWDFDPPRRVRVVGPEGLGARLDMLHEEPGFTERALDVTALGEGTRRIGPFEIETRQVTHTDESYGFRVSVGDDGRGLVYSGDCGRVEDVVPLVRAGDVLLVEASFGPGPIEPGVWHLDGRAVAEVAAATSPSLVLLTHILPWRQADETVAIVRNGWDGPVRAVWPGDEIAI